MIYIGNNELFKRLKVIIGNNELFKRLKMLKFHKNSSKIHKMTFGMQRSMCEKVANFKSLKVSKLLTLKSKYFVNIFI